MSQVPTARAVSTASQPAKETLAAARKSDCFAAVFDQARKASRQQTEKRERLDRSDRSQARDRSSRTGDSDAKTKTAASRSHETGNTKPSRSERIKEAAKDARADKAAASDSADKSAQAHQEAKSQSTDSKQNSAQTNGQTEQDAQQESNDHELNQQQANLTAVVQASAPSSTTTDAAAGAASGSPGSAWVPPGTSSDLPGGPLPVQTQGAQSGGDSSTGVNTAVARAQAVTAVQQEADADTTGATAGDKAKPVAATDGQNKTAGTDFQNLLGQAGRARQLTQSLKTAATSSASPSDAARKPIDIDSAAGPEDLARVVRSKVGARHSNMTIQLDPPELGPVRVDVRMHDEAMTVRFQAQTQAGHDALQGRLHELTGALEQQGVRLDKVEVEYRPPAEGQPDGQSQAQQHTSQQWQEPSFTGDGGQWQSQPQTPSFSAGSIAEAATPSTGAQLQGGLLAASGVDVVV